MTDPAPRQRLRHYGRRLGRKLRPGRVALLETLLPEIRIPLAAGKPLDPWGAPPRHSHGDPTSLAPHERLTDLAVVPREKPHTGAAAGEQPRDSPVTRNGWLRLGTNFVGVISSMS